MSCGVGRRRTLDMVLLRLWCRQAATALIRPLAWEPPYAKSVTLKKSKKKKKELDKDILKCHKQFFVVFFGHFEIVS